ncbi:MAG: MFS transporter [Ruminococcaceae bacterium]|nr:MFS transporter [Oscillospiraceae bacterium]
MKKIKPTVLERSWILYDVGNSAFVLLYSTLLPLFFYELATTARLDEELYLSYWGYAGSIATVLVALIGPICGAIADQKDYKKLLFVISLICGALSCAALGFSWIWWIFLIVYILAKAGYSASLVFYDSMLPEVAPEERADRVSSKGYAYGYIGSVIPFVLCIGVFVCYYMLQIISMEIALLCVTSITAVWWIACSVPLIKRYRQTAFMTPTPHPIAEAFRELGRTLKHAKQHPNILWYLLAFFFFINGVYTIIDMAIAYGESLGLDSIGLLLALLVTQIVAFPFAILFGVLASKVRAGRLIKLCILCYAGIISFAVFLTAQWQFWMLAVLVGMFQGGIQALSRSYLTKIIPVERSGAYFGLMDICGKGATFLGMLLVAVVNHFLAGKVLNVFGISLGNENIAVASLLILMLLGYIFFCKADKLNQK